MDWTEIRITVDAKDVDRAGDIAQMVVPYGIYTEDYSHLEEEAREIAHIDLIDEELLKKDRTKGIVHVYISPEDNPAEAISFLRERYDAEEIPCEISTAACVEEDWINNWKQYFKPIPVGEKLVIRPTWETYRGEAGENRVVLDLAPCAFERGAAAVQCGSASALERRAAPVECAGCAEPCACEQRRSFPCRGFLRRFRSVVCRKFGGFLRRREQQCRFVPPGEQPA